MFVITFSNRKNIYYFFPLSYILVPNSSEVSEGGWGHSCPTHFFHLSSLYILM